MINGETILFAALGGMLPALLWLWFWLFEDKKHPEPKRLIFLAFFMGMLTIPFVVPLQKYAQTFLFGTALIVTWAAIEELFKYFFAYFSVLRRREVDEPIDAVIYMISVALGFAALENALFLLDPITNGGFVEGILTGNFRFFGATLLHTLSSATVGVFIALGFCKSRATKRLLTAIGIILAISLHTLFNFFIIRSNGTDILVVFGFVWVGIIALLLMLERIKNFKNVCLEFFKRK
ncbi:PrsW family intramembrane metalloprotease [Candidatus Kaiserbacteria bacterium]|nr:PrsW family intramembrane metalloprotease [Candidatus Kaiserbacteria bacterium]